MSQDSIFCSFSCRPPPNGWTARKGNSNEMFRHVSEETRTVTARAVISTVPEFRERCKETMIHSCTLARQFVPVSFQLFLLFSSPPLSPLPLSSDPLSSSHPSPPPCAHHTHESLKFSEVEMRGAGSCKRNVGLFSFLLFSLQRCPLLVFSLSLVYAIYSMCHIRGAPLISLSRENSGVCMSNELSTSTLCLCCLKLVQRDSIRRIQYN